MKFKLDINKPLAKSVAIFVALVAVIVGFAYFGDSGGELTRARVRFEGAELLDKPGYLRFARMETDSALRAGDLPTLRDRVRQHPYVVSTRVERAADGKVVVRVVEREPIAVAIVGAKPYLIMSDRALAPYYPEAKALNLPVAINTEYKEPPPGGYVADDLLHAYRVARAIKAVDEAMYDRLSDLDLTGDERTTLRFVDMKPRAIISRKNEVENLLRLRETRRSASAFRANVDDYDYVDVRYRRHIFLGRENRETSL
jgi:cell division septal protein FtsQ